MSRPPRGARLDAPRLEDATQALVEDPCGDCGRRYRRVERVRWLVASPDGSGARVAWEGCVDCWVRKTSIPAPVTCEWAPPDHESFAIVRICLRWSACWHFYRWTATCPECLLTRLANGVDARISTECPECKTISPLTVANVEAIRGLHA